MKLYRFLSISLNSIWRSIITCNLDGNSIQSHLSYEGYLEVSLLYGSCRKGKIGLLIVAAAAAHPRYYYMSSFLKWKVTLSSLNVIFLRFVILNAISKLASVGVKPSAIHPLYCNNSILLTMQYEVDTPTCVLIEQVRDQT
jgi:hypothetical protein